MQFNDPGVIAAGFVVLLAAAFALRNWHQALLLCLVVGILQDVLRKASSSQSPIFNLLVVICFGLIILTVLARRYPLTLHDQMIWRRDLRVPFAFFLAWISFQAGLSFINYGSVIIVSLGLISYLAALPAVLVGYHFALQAGTVGLIRWMKFYVMVALVGLVTVYLEFSGATSGLLGEVGVGITIYDLGTVLEAYSGIFRSSEVAGWHAATTASFIVILFLSRGVSVSRLVVALAAASLVIGLGMLTGRRKMAVQFVIFCLVFFALLLRSDRQSRAALTIASLMATAIGAGASFDYTNSMSSAFGLYFERTSTVFGDIWERFVELGLAPVNWAYNQFGLFGGGLGVASQGRQYVGGLTVGAAEGGLGKIMAELGAPGLLLVGVLLIVLARAVLRSVRFVGRFQRPTGRIASGLLAFLVSNLATFVVATPVFGDVNILLMLGLALGFIVACPSLELANSNFTAAGAVPRFAMKRLAMGRSY